MTGLLISEMNEVLVPLDGRDASLRSIPVAGRIASRLGVEMCLFGVADDTARMKDWLEAQTRRFLASESAKVEAAASDDVVGAIVDRAGEESLVCMATAATLRPHHGHVGSVAEEVVRRMGRPIGLIGPETDLYPGEPTRRVILPLDGSELSEAGMVVAGDLAATIDVPLWVVTVVSPKAEQTATWELGVAPGGAESGYVRNMARDLRKRFDIDVEYEVLHWEDPAKAVVDFAGDDGTVVMSTHGRSGLSRVFGGSVATGVVAHSSRPVVVLRPEGE